MRVLFFVAGAALTLAACGGTESTTNTSTTGTNMMASDPMMMNGSDPMMGGTMGNTMGGDMGNTMGGNMMGADPATQNAMRQDMNTNDPDTNLANGM